MEFVIDLGSRRIQFIHGSAFINLPRTWVKTNDLRKGDLVTIGLRRNGSLEISCLDESVKGGA